ncbi:MAG TPA: hypothetical protein VNX68_14025, partial [Nitrosopumilaceae archaeon]|nr:hypothetical protein [Nitrosopumilaceae archaeon]
PRKLLFRSYDESLTTGGQEMYYFDDTGKVMGHINLMIGATIHDIYSGQIVMIYTKSGKNINSSQLSNDEMSNYILADAKYVIDYYLSNFEGLKYSTFDVSNNTSYILKTLVNTTLRSAPDFKASAIKEIVRGVGLFYLDRSLKKDSVSGKGKWIWIKVKDKGKNVGWIWGHPSIVKPY